MRRNFGARREGSTLIFVLVVLAMISYGVYSFSEFAVAEAKALRFTQDRVHALAAAQSGIDHLLAQFENGNPRSAADVQLQHQWASRSGQVSQFSIQQNANDQSIGLTNECSRLNLNSLDLSAEATLTSRRRLLVLPGMTRVTADSLLDWLDNDETPRKYGAETAWYLAQNLPQRPRNGNLKSLEELSLVRGFDRILPGLLPYVTVLSAEANFNDRGSHKVHINQNTLAELYRLLKPVVGANGARFIVALRMNGPMHSDNARRFDSLESIEQRRETARARAVEQSTERLQIVRTQPKVVGGLTINRAPIYTIRSIASLLGRHTRAMIDGNETTLESPWKGNSMAVTAELAQLESVLSVHEHPRAPGRINPALAPTEVLETVPGISDSLAGRIAQHQRRLRGQPASIGWLVRNNLMPLKQLRQVSPYLTSGGDVYTGVSVGRFGALNAAVLFELDNTASVPTIVRRTELPPEYGSNPNAEDANEKPSHLSIVGVIDR